MTDDTLNWKFRGRCGGRRPVRLAGCLAIGLVAKSAALQYAQCMRSHGVKNFPDPNSQGGFQIEPGDGINPSSYSAANQACRHYLSGEPGGGQTVIR